MNLSIKAGFCLSCITLLGTAQAASLSYDDFFAASTTDWDHIVTFPKFSIPGATLNSVSFFIEGTLWSNTKIESLDKAPSLVSALCTGSLILSRPDQSPLASALSSVVCLPHPLAAFDGVLDFTGTSGKDFGTQACYTSSSYMSASAADLALFNGAGSIMLPLSTKAVATVSGAGNVVSQINTKADAHVQIVYNFQPTPPVPEPGTVSLFVGAGISGISMLSFRRRRK